VEVTEYFDRFSYTKSPKPFQIDMIFPDGRVERRKRKGNGWTTMTLHGGPPESPPDPDLHKVNPRDYFEGGNPAAEHEKALEKIEEANEEGEADD
jgi:hypothetical protein